jgi:hypothetical protein
MSASTLGARRIYLGNNALLNRSLSRCRTRGWPNRTHSTDYLALWQMPVAYDQPLAILITPILVELKCRRSALDSARGVEMTIFRPEYTSSAPAVASLQSKPPTPGQGRALSGCLCGRDPELSKGRLPHIARRDRITKRLIALSAHGNSNAVDAGLSTLRCPL